MDAVKRVAQVSRPRRGFRGPGRQVCRTRDGCAAREDASPDAADEPAPRQAGGTMGRRVFSPGTGLGAMNGLGSRTRLTARTRSGAGVRLGLGVHFRIAPAIFDSGSPRAFTASESSLTWAGVTLS